MTFIHSLADAWVRRRVASAGPPEASSGLRPATVITGGSRGIGLALAKRFAAEGHAVMAVARHPGPLAQAVDEIRAHSPGATVHSVALDVTERSAFAHLSKSLQAEGLYLDILINNAGIGLGGAFQDHTVDQIDGLISLNVAAVTRLTRLALPELVARGRGGIINVASMGGYVPGPYQAAYYASKAYVISLTEAVASECAGQGVRVAVVAPGPVETAFHASMQAESAIYRRVLPAATPEQIAASVWWQYRLGRRVIVPGLLNPFGAYALRVLPHVLSVPMMGWLLKPRLGR